MPWRASSFLNGLKSSLVESVIAGAGSSRRDRDGYVVSSRSYVPFPFCQQTSSIQMLLAPLGFLTFRTMQ